MNQASSAADIERMLSLAEEYIADAEILARAADKASHADYLLKLTAFEILLKALRIAEGLAPSRSHSYGELFCGLPDPVQQEILTLASDRIGPSAEYSDRAKLLGTYHRNFIALRYAYEPYEGMTAAQVHELGDQWLSRGAPVDEATFAFYPEELFGLIEALRVLLKRHLSNTNG